MTLVQTNSTKRILTITTLQPITIKVQHTKEFKIEEYIEWCEDQSIVPSQRHYKKWAIEQMEDILRDNIDTNQFKFKLGEVEEVEFEIEE